MLTTFDLDDYVVDMPLAPAVLDRLVSSFVGGRAARPDPRLG